MTALMPFVDQSWAQALAWTLVHFIWQGAALGLAAYAVLRFCRLDSPARYSVAVVALASMLAAPAVTFAVLASGPSSGAATGSASALEVQIPYDGAAVGRHEAGAMALDQSAPLQSAIEGASVPAASASASTGRLVPIVLIAWMAGVAALSIRLLGGWWVARRLVTRAIRPVSPEVHAMARRVAGRLALDRIVRFVESTSVAVPVTVGWLKPVVLLPAAAMSGLSTVQIEALVAHELAHVRRHDYLVNLLQSAVETLLFYHPAVWWASRVIRAEREHCCDDVAVTVCDRVVYVSALSDLAALTTSTPRLALAATDGSLLSRVRRLLGHPAEDGASGSSWLPMGLVVLLAAALVPAAMAQSSGAGRVATEEADVAAGVNSGTVAGVTQGVRAQVATTGAGQSQDRARSQGRSVAGVVAVAQSREPDRARVVAEVQAAADQAASEQALQERIRELERAIAAMTGRLREQQSRLEREQLSLERAAVVASTQARAVELEAEMRLAEERFQRARQQFEVGVVNRSALVEAEVRLQQLRAEFAGLHENREIQERQLELAQQRAAVRAQSGAEVERLQQELQAVERQRARRAVAAAPDRARVEELVATLREMQAQYPLENDLLVARSEVVSDPAAEVRERDVLVIRISDEPGLPTVYEVDTAGAIRLPLLGSVQVRGLTRAGVQTAVSDMLADRQLARGATISVTLRRPR